MAVKNLAEALAYDLADSGLGNYREPNSIQSLDGETLLEINQNGDIITVHENGEQVIEIKTSHEHFNEELMAYFASALNF